MTRFDSRHKSEVPRTFAAVDRRLPASTRVLLALHDRRGGDNIVRADTHALAASAGVSEAILFDALDALVLAGRVSVNLIPCRESHVFVVLHNGGKP